MGAEAGIGNPAVETSKLGIGYCRILLTAVLAQGAGVLIRAAEPKGGTRLTRGQHAPSVFTGQHFIVYQELRLATGLLFIGSSLVAVLMGYVYRDLTAVRLGLLWGVGAIGVAVGVAVILIPWHRFHPLYYAVLTPAATLLATATAVALGGAHALVVPIFYLVIALVGASLWPLGVAFLINSIVIAGALWTAFYRPDDWYLRQLVLLIPSIVAVTFLSSNLMRRLLDERKERAKLSALAEASEVSASLDLEASLSQTYSHLRDLVGARACLVYLFDGLQRVFVLKSIQHEEGVYTPEELSLLHAIQIRLGESLIGLAAESGNTLLSGDLSRDPRAMYPSESPDSAIFVPLKGKERVTGVMVVGREGRDQFDDEDAEIVTLFARQVGSALENSRLFSEASERATRLEVMRELGRLVSSTLDQESILRMVGPEVARLVTYDRFSLVLLDETGTQSRVEVVIDSRGARGMQPGQVIPVRGSAMEYMLEQRRPYNEGDLRLDRFAEDRWLAEAGFLSCLRVPLETNGRVLGMLALSSRRLNRYRDHEAEALMEVARQVAVAIHNARMYKQSQERARTDPLTGLHNRRYFNEAWLRESATARRLRAPLSLMMADVYDLRIYNETYGQLAGDERLTEAAEILRSLMRPGDVAARFGGDEFALIMPQTDDEAAREVERQLQQALAQWNARHEETDRPPLLLSTGVVTGTGEEVAALITRADLAARRARDSMDRQQRLALQEKSRRERQRHIVQTVLSLAKVEEIKDPYTRGHSERMRNYAVSAARSLGLAEPEVEEIGYGAILHDIGKIAIPTEILHKPAKLTPEEMSTMRQHPVIGQNIIGELEVLGNVQALVRHHHERYDGGRDEPHAGYPDGLKGENIPLGARIIAVVDAYDAMTTDRPYRKGMSHRDAVSELRRHAGSQFDPEVVEAFIQVLESTPDEGTENGVTNDRAG